MAANFDSTKNSPRSIDFGLAAGQRSADGSCQLRLGRVDGVRAGALAHPVQLHDPDVQTQKVLKVAEREGRCAHHEQVGLTQPQCGLHLGKHQLVGQLVTQ